ncbi:hypothetical protein QPL79_07880 [Ignisphaera sp. 4213-co]|uniref:TFIIS-type domain-containing protein n=1 Tax=Ignisphaera cupida TaxID=3050454 RepID=A0ABD4Z7G2_9CREN|nr:hypothetical protein [Ignisphaera sp. 4213-co]MDK6029281.1 hypothetical protein [Ignisphaera sp. 4213-co]
MVVKSVDGVSTLVCVKCGYRKTLSKDSSVMLRKSTVFTQYIEKKEEVVLGIPPGAIFEETIVCPQCGKKGVYYWRKHASSAESSDSIVKTFKCSNCGYTWIEME